jgi:hypothetical protein
LRATRPRNPAKAAHRLQRASAIELVVDADLVVDVVVVVDGDGDGDDRVVFARIEREVSLTRAARAE